MCLLVVCCSELLQTARRCSELLRAAQSDSELLGNKSRVAHRLVDHRWPGDIGWQAGMLLPRAVMTL